MRVSGLVALSLGAACYAPSPQPGAPCANGACPSGLVCAPATQTCELAAGVDAAIDLRDAGRLDGANVAVDASPDAPSCYGAGLVKVCPSAPITSPLSITSTTVVDTDASPLCIAYSDGVDDAYCVIAGTVVTIAENRRLRAVGSRPLVVVATTAMVIGGTIDVSAGAGANPPTCVAPTPATNKQGGAGGSFQGRGGSGAAAVSGLGPMSAPATTTPAFRGGCPGGAGAGPNGGSGGSGGGALYLIAPSIAIDGTLDASGAGGNGGTNASGGGGGGSGGFIGLDAPMVIVAAGARVFANGGGGGEGGTPNRGGNGGTTPGSPSAASGGSGGANHGGNGGAGSGDGRLDGADGDAGGNCGRGGSSGGGGGGGAGFIYVFPAQALGGAISPPP